MTDAVRTMRAMCASSSDPSGLTSQNVPVPDPGPGELLVEVRGNAITTGELSWPESWPAIPCHDLSGVVAATGDGVEGWRSGDEVYGLVGFDRPGAAAEYVLAPAQILADAPASIPLADAAALPSVGLTAWQSLFEHADLRHAEQVGDHLDGRLFLPARGRTGHRVVGVGSCRADKTVRERLVQALAEHLELQRVEELVDLLPVPGHWQQIAGHGAHGPGRHVGEQRGELAVAEHAAEVLA